MYDSHFRSNTARQGHGGALWFRGGAGARAVDLNVSSSSFVSNAAQFGGAIEAYYARARLTGVRFEGNSARAGGAFRVYGGCPADCCNCACPCHHVSDGVVSPWPVLIDGCAFGSNGAGGGGQVSLNGPSLQLRWSSFEHDARAGPRALAVVSSAAVAIDGCTCGANHGANRTAGDVRWGAECDGWRSSVRATERRRSVECIFSPSGVSVAVHGFRPAPTQ